MAHWGKVTSPMTSCLAVGTYEGRLFGWDVSAAASSDESSDKASLTFALSYALAAHEGPVRCVAVDSGGKFFVTGGADETIRIYNLKRKREVGVLLEHTDEVTCLAFVGKSHLLSGGADNTVCIWRVSDWVCLHKLGGHKGAVTSIAPHVTGRLALTTSLDGTLRLWDLVKGRIAYITRLGAVGEKVIWSPASDMYCILYRDKLVVSYAATGEVLHTLTPSVRMHDALWTASGNIIAAADESKLFVWEAESGRLVKDVVTPHKFRVRNLGQLAREGVLITSDPQGIVLVWSLADIVSPDRRGLTPLYTLRDAGSSRSTCLVVHEDDAGAAELVPEPAPAPAPAPAAAAPAKKKRSLSKMKVTVSVPAGGEAGGAVKRKPSSGDPATASAGAGKPTKKRV